jgi:peptidoglycan/LPS O-acetylase OafA/YrhL
MDRRTSLPRGLVGRSVLAAGIFAAAVVPGWTLGGLVERWTGWGLLDWFVTCAWTAAAGYALAPYSSYRRRDAWLALLPLLGWYLVSVMSWRVALLPYRDWEPRGDELWRARWLTGDLIGYWRADRATAAAHPRRKPEISKTTELTRGGKPQI